MSDATKTPIKRGARRLVGSSAIRSVMTIGDVWIMRILRDAFRGHRRFGEWEASLGIGKPLLSNRLSRLVKAGVFRKTPVERTPGFKEYVLTEQGLDLWPLFIAIWKWEQTWDRNPLIQRGRLTHLTCGHQITPVSSCSHCGKPLDAFSTSPIPGPGASGTYQAPPRLQRRSEVAADRPGEVAMGTQAAKILGDLWINLIIAAGFTGAKRFADFEERVGISPAVLADRLKLMVDLGVFNRSQYQAGPNRFEYRFSRKGLDIFPITLELVRWGDKWLAGKSGPPLLVIHKDCGHAMHNEFRCSECGEVLKRRDLRLKYAVQRQVVAKSTQ